LGRDFLSYESKLSAAYEISESNFCDIILQSSKPMSAVMAGTRKDPKNDLSPERLTAVFGASLTIP
jgi:putative sterol carrier protein